MEVNDASDVEALVGIGREAADRQVANLVTERDRLRAEVDREKALNRRLWLVIAKQQQALGMAYAMDSNFAAHDEMVKMTGEADALLDGVVALDPAT